MLSLSPHNLHLSTFIFNNGSLLPNLNPNPNPCTLKPFITSSISPTSSSSSSSETSVTIEALNASVLTRRQNAKSTALVLNNLKLDVDEEDEESLQRKQIIEEASLATRRIARFPGSIDFPKPDQFVTSVDLSRVVLESDDDVIKKALEVRRGVAAEILKNALRAGKLSINYSNNLVSRLGGFVDRVVIEVAAMKVLFLLSSISAGRKDHRKRNFSAIEY